MESRAQLKNPAPVFVYFFNHTLQSTLENAPWEGCFHSSELNLVFFNKGDLLLQSEIELSYAFVK